MNKKEYNKQYRIKHGKELNERAKKYVELMRNQNKLINLIRGVILGRDINEKYIFNNSDLKYINEIAINKD